jgi:copper chaperone CopZ
MAVQKLYVRDLAEDDEERVERALRDLRGVLFATASHADRCAEVEFEDDVVTTDAMVRALADLGFEARIAG